MGRMFIGAGKRLGLEVNLFSYELHADVPVSEIAGIIVGRRWSDPDILDHLHEVVEENRIDILIPFVDPAVGIAARYCAADPECRTPFRDVSGADLLFDKVKADSVFRQLGFPVPKNALLDEVAGKIIAKPRRGSASKGLRVLEREEFERMRSEDAAADYLFQEYVDEREEYTVDCYVTDGGHFVCAVPRVRLAVAGGEVTDTVTVSDAGVERLSRHILKELDLRGAVTIQFLKDRRTGELMLMEINPRLGGGAVCSVHAGACLPEFILSDWMGQRVEECTGWKAGVKICRYPQEVVFYPQ